MQKRSVISSSIALALCVASFAHAECSLTISTAGGKAGSYALSGGIFLDGDVGPSAEFQTRIREGKISPFQSESEFTYVERTYQERNQDGSPRILFLTPGTYTVGVSALFGLALENGAPVLKFCVRHAKLERMEESKHVSGYSVKPLVARREMSKENLPISLGEDQVFAGDGWRVRLRVDQILEKDS